MRTKLVSATVATTAFALALGLSGCSASTGPVTVDHSAANATVSAGEQLTIDFGEVNPSVGDGWAIIEKPDTAVLSGGDQKVEPIAKDNRLGGPATLQYTFKAEKAGTTTVEFEYRYRGNVPENPADQKQASITVTVR